jgi:hypothetical protein
MSFLVGTLFGVFIGGVIALLLLWVIGSTFRP